MSLLTLLRAAVTGGGTVGAVTPDFGVGDILLATQIGGRSSLPLFYPIRGRCEGLISGYMAGGMQLGGRSSRPLQSATYSQCTGDGELPPDVPLFGVQVGGRDGKPLVVATCRQCCVPCVSIPTGTNRFFGVVAESAGHVDLDDIFPWQGSQLAGCYNGAGVTDLFPPGWVQGSAFSITPDGVGGYDTAIRCTWYNALATWITAYDEDDSSRTSFNCDPFVMVFEGTYSNTYPPTPGNAWSDLYAGQDYTLTVTLDP